MAEAHLQPVGHPTDRLLGTSPAMAALRAQIRHLASFDVVGSPHVPTILLQGETGTGKGLLTHVIHDSGPRAQGPFIEVNCAAIPDTMLEAELFGFEAGAFTDAKRAKPGLLEAASGGTLFLDEVDALPLALQSKFLTVLESRRVRRLGAVAERTVDVKLIAATNAVLSEAVAAGRVRADLYHRLAVVVLALPPLRARDEDIVALAEAFLQHYTAAHGVSPKRLSAEAEAWLQAYAWPGNVRELSHLMERVTLLHVGEEVDATTLMHLCQPRTPPAAGDEAAMAPQRPEPAEAAQIRRALAQTGGNVTRAARLLGVSRDTVRYRMQRYGLARLGSAAPPPPATAGSPLPLHAPEAGFPGLPAPGEGRKGYPSAEPAEDPMLPHTGREREQPSSEAMASQRARHDATVAPHIPAAEATWEQKPVAVLALEVTWPEATGVRSMCYDPWTEQARWQQAMVDKVQGFGGVLLQRAPALLTWVFGLPQTLEQLPQRAVHSALAVRQMVADARAADLAVSPEVRLAVHLGAVRWDGRADARTASLLAVGDTMARPVRLLGQAGAGEVVVSPEVGRLVEGWVVLEMRVGGYAVLGVSHGRATLASGGRPARSPFVGRAREFALLEAVLGQVQAGQGQVVGLMGVPGIGKSRLLEEFRRSLADKRVTYQEARCLAYGSAIPYLPVRDLLQDNCGISETDSHEAMAEKVRLALQEVGMDPAAGEPYLLHLLGVPLGTERLASLHPKALKARTFEILQELNVHSSWRQPLILAVEDLQWIDPTSEEFLASLVERMGSAPILLLMTYRPEYRPPWMGKSYVSQLALSPLASLDSLCLVRAVLQTAQVPAALEQLLLAKAGGNPFFLEELLQGLLEQGVVVREAGEVQQLADQSHAPPMTAIPLPPTVQVVLAARIDRLPPAAKRLLQMAAVIGMEVPFNLLRAVAQLPEEALRSGLAALHAAEFLYETRFLPERTYTFKHALTQEVAYRSLLPARRQALHEAIGSAIEALYPERLDEQCELLAHHFTRSRNVAKAVHYLATSGQRAVRLFAYEQALAFFQEALGCLEGLTDSEALRKKEVEILLELELVCDNLARRGEQRRLLEQLIHSAQTLDDPELLSDAYIRRSQFLSVGGAVEDALAEAERALTLKRRVGDQRGEAKALRAMGFIYWQLRRYEDALRAHRQALEVHRAVGDRVAASVELFNLGEILRQLQQHQEALQCLEEARQLLSALEDPLGLALCYYNIGNVYRDLGGYATALRYYQETLASRLRLPHGRSTLWCAPFMGIAMIQSQLGDHREALKYYREALAISQRLGDHRDMVATLQPLAATYEILGEVSDALTYYQQALALSQELGDRHAERSILTSLGHLYRRQLRDFPAALASYRQSLAIDREIGDGDGRLTLLKGLGATCWNLGLYEEAASAFEQALVIVETNGDRAEQAVIRSSLGVTESSLHRYATALAHLREGLAIAKALGDPQAEGYILNALGNVYYEVGDQRRAQDCYQQAIQLRRRIRDRRGEGWSLHYLGRSHAEVGEIEEARRLQEQALNLADEIGDAELQVGARLALAAVHCHQEGGGAAKTSLRYAQQAVELSRVNGLHREESVGLSQQAMALLLLSKVEAARSCSEEAIQRLDEAGGARQPAGADLAAPCSDPPGVRTGGACRWLFPASQ